MIVAVNDSFVVPISTTMKITGFFQTRDNPALAPDAREYAARRIENELGGWSAVAAGSAGRAGLGTKAISEQAAIDGALAECGRQDQNCRVIAIGPFSVEPRKEAPAPVTPVTMPRPPTEAADTKGCLNENSPASAIGICKVFIANNGGLSRSTLASVYNKLAWASLQVKDNQSVLSWTKKSLDIAPNAVEYYVAGQAYAALNDPTHAVEEFSKALIVAPKYLLALHRRGEAYLQLGETEHAKSDFEAALSLHANFKPSLEALRRLKQRS